MVSVCCRCVVVKWLVGPSSTSNRATCFFISLGDTGRCYGVSLCRADASGQRRVRCWLPFFGVNGPQRIITQNRTRRHAASFEAFALYVIQCPSVRWCVCDSMSVRPVVCVLVANGSLDLAARAILLQAFLFQLAIQGAATEFHCAGQMHRTRDARAVGCHSARFCCHSLVSTGLNAS